MQRFYHEDTAGKKYESNKGIHKNQLKQNRESNQLSLFNPRNPFKEWQVTNTRLLGQ